MRIQKGKPLYLTDHLKKLQEQMALFGIRAELSPDTIFDFIRRNELGEARLKILVTGGDERELALPKRRGRVVMLAESLPTCPEVLRLVPMRYPLFPGKLLSYMPRLFLKEQAKPYDDCLLLGEGGEILETAIGNLFWEVDGELFTPDPTRLPIYWGVSIEKFCQKKVVQRVCTTLKELPKQAQLFRINAVFGVVSALLISSDQG